MTDSSLIEIINAFNAIVFSVLILTGAGATIARLVRYRYYKVRVPRLLMRDALWHGSYGALVVLLFGVRVLGMIGAVANSPIWYAVTGFLAIFGAGIYTYYELFVIEQSRDDD